MWIIIAILILILFVIIWRHDRYRRSIRAGDVNDTRWIIYEKTGGIAGIDQKVIIYHDKSYEIHDQGKIIDHGILNKNIHKEVREALKCKIKDDNNTRIVDGMYYTLSIDGRMIMQKNSLMKQKRPTLLYIIDELIYDTYK